MSEGDPPPDGSHGPHVLVDDVETPVLAGDDRHHLERVLRVRPGDPITVGDGRGRWRACRMADEPDPVGDVRIVAEPTRRVAVGFALIKGGRPELVVQKLTELGVDRIVPFTAARSVVRWDGEKSDRNVERLRRVAREAVMQSRRAWEPTVGEVTDLIALGGEPGAAMADRGGTALDAETSLLLIGPEGGWSDEDYGLGLPRIRIAGPILRAETAAIAAGVLLSAQRDAHS